jgi:hypothetical protein
MVAATVPLALSFYFIKIFHDFVFFQRIGNVRIKMNFSQLETKLSELRHTVPPEALLSVVSD